jgi:hypothetical protein
VTVLKGVIPAKQLEDELSRILPKGWRWTARKVADNMFTVRFPNALLIQEWACLNPIKMRSVKAKIHIASWNGSVGAKGELQQAWFRVRGVPYDKMSAQPITCVGSLVGVTTEVDKSTLNRADFIRVKIAVKDVSKVPESTEGAILPYLYDFFCEREVVLEEKKESKAVLVQVDKKDPKKLSPQKSEMFEPSVQISLLKDVVKYDIGECNAKKQQVDGITSVPLFGPNAVPGDSREPEDMSAKRSLEPQNLKPMLMREGSDELDLLRARIDIVLGLSGADYNDSEDDMCGIIEVMMHNTLHTPTIPMKYSETLTLLQFEF